MSDPRLLVSSIGTFDDKTEKFSNYWLRFEFFCKVNKVEATLQPGVFLATVGPKTFALCQDLLAPAKLESCSLQDIENVLRKHFDPVKNIIYERFVFFSRNQKSNESINEYVHALKSLASTCDFGSYLKDMLRDRLVVGIRDQKIQRTLLSIATLTFEQAVTNANSMELASKEVSLIQGGHSSNSVNAVNSNSHDKSNFRKHRARDISKIGAKSGVSLPKSYSCFSCGESSHLRSNCKFKDSKCFGCGKTGHLKKLCRNR